MSGSCVRISIGGRWDLVGRWWNDPKLLWRDVTGAVGQAAELEETAAIQDAIDNCPGEIAIVQHLAPRRERLIGRHEHRLLALMPLIDDAIEHVGGVLLRQGQVSDFVDLCGAPHNVDDFAMKEFRGTSAADMLDVILRRHEMVSTMITSNRPTEDWGHFMRDVPAATAILDRVLQDCNIVTMHGESYRLGRRLFNHASENGSEDIDTNALVADQVPAKQPHPSGVKRRPAPGKTADLRAFGTPVTSTPVKNVVENNT